MDKDICDQMCPLTTTQKIIKIWIAILHTELESSYFEVYGHIRPPPVEPHKFVLQNSLWFSYFLHMSSLNTF